MSDAPGVVYLWPQDGVEWDKLQVGGSLCAYDGPCYWMSEHAKKYVRANTLTALEAENKRLREALNKQVAFYAMDLTLKRGAVSDLEIADIEFRRDIARAALEGE